jgi:hypothetical protein
MPPQQRHSDSALQVSNGVRAKRFPDCLTERQHIPFFGGYPCACFALSFALLSVISTQGSCEVSSGNSHVRPATSPPRTGAYAAAFHLGTMPQWFFISTVIPATRKPSSNSASTPSPYPMIRWSGSNSRSHARENGRLYSRRLKWLRE